MAVPEQTPYKEYTANGSTTSFALGFICDSKSDLIVLVDGIAPPIATWSLTDGNAVFTTAPASGKKIILQRQTKFERTTNFQGNNNSFRPETINKDIDRVWLKLQELGVADMLLKIYVDRLHGEQKDYVDNKDQLVRNIISDLRNYVNQQDNDLVDSISNLRIHVDQQDNNRNSYFENLISRQGVSLQQLDSYYKHLLQGIANIATAKGWLASLVVDASGKNQQEINNNTAYFYKTVAQMIADMELTDGVIVGTKGYHNIFDDGGAIYLISAVATDYSIPLANGLHAVFRDTFDIRKFGVRNDVTLDQTTELVRMRNYADDRVYGIDFHNFKIMVPETEQAIKTGVHRFIKGLIFNKVHEIKNLHIANNKSKQLRYNTVCLAFLPKTDGVGTFKLTNVTFDPYVENFLLNPSSGDGDGYMHGFVAAWHGEFPIGWPANQQFETGYSTEYDNVRFISPAVSYNLATNFWCRSQRITNSSGEYWGLYLWHWATSVHAKNVHGVFRDDLQTARPRNLVTNLFHEEQEVKETLFPYSQDEQYFCDITAYTYTTGVPHDAVKRLGMGAPTLQQLTLKNITGVVDYHFGSDKAGFARVENILIEGGSQEVSILVDVGKIVIKDTKLPRYVFTNPAFSVGTVELHDTELTYGICYGAVVINDLQMFRGRLSNTTEGLCRSSSYLKNIRLWDVEISSGRVVECRFDTLRIKDGEVNTRYFSEFIKCTKTDNTSTEVRINGTRFTVNKGDSGNLISCVSGQPMIAHVKYCDFISKPNFNIGTLGTLYYQYNTPIPTGSKNHDWGNLAAGAVQSTTLTVNGVAPGDSVVASMNVSLGGTRLWAEVTALNTVTIYQQNPTAAAVDVVSGTLTVKAV